jgi:WD40 repeat protein
LATAGADKTVRLWDVLTGKQIAMLNGHTAEITSLTFGPDEILFSGSRDKTVRAWLLSR